MPWLAAQTAQIENIEKNLAKNPDDPSARMRILQLLSDPNVAGEIPYSKLIEKRREQILWMIEYYPDFHGSFLRSDAVIAGDGMFADPEGYARSVELWKKVVASPNATTQAVANAANYLKSTDRRLAREILNTALAQHPEDPALERAVGVVDAAAMMGIDGVIERGQFTASREVREGAEAQAACKEIEASTNGYVLAGAAQLFVASVVRNQGQIDFGDDDAVSLAEKWLRRAIALSPSTEEFKTMLFQVLRNAANRPEDPRERVRLFAEAVNLAPDREKANLLPDLARAEFEAGDDAAAERDAKAALEHVAEVNRRNQQLGQSMIHRANIVLGRIALTKGNVAEAKARLLASLDLPEDTAQFRFGGPDMSLARELTDAGERDAVIEFLERSRKFWFYDRGQIDHRIRMVKAGRKGEAFANYFHPGFEIVNQPAPDFKLTDLGGKEWTLASLSGKKAALVFWNTACKTCGDEIARLEKEAEPLKVRLLAIDVGDPDGAVKAFVEKNKLAVPVLKGGEAIKDRYRADVYPSTALIDAGGRVLQYQVGLAPNPKQLLESGGFQRLMQPVPLRATDSGGRVTLAWEPAVGAQSYLVEWQMDQKDEYVRVIATRETHVEVDCKGRIRWRVYAVEFGMKSDPMGWQTAESRDLQ
jgi:peroxiredoxin